MSLFDLNFYFRTIRPYVSVVEVVIPCIPVMVPVAVMIIVVAVPVIVISVIGVPVVRTPGIPVIWTVTPVPGRAPGYVSR